MQTNIPVGDAQAIRRYASALAVDWGRMHYWKKFTSTGTNSPVQEKVDLQSAAGDTIQFDLLMQMRGQAVYGDDVAEGKEENLSFLIDEVKIDQIRKPGDAGGRMSRKRTLHDLRKLVKEVTAEWMAGWWDEVMFSYASGVAGSAAANEDALFTDSSFAGNPIQAPDSSHITYGGDATSKASVASDDVMNLSLCQRLATKATMIKARNPDAVDMKPIRTERGEHFVLVVSPDQAYTLRTASAATDWLEVTKHAAQRGQENGIFTNDLGKIAGLTLHEHKGIRRFSDYGSGVNLPAARALLLGRQALTTAFGSGNGTRMMWDEELADFKNRVKIAAGMICGVKKTRFAPKNGGSSMDFGVMAVDTYAAAVT